MPAALETHRTVRLGRMRSRTVGDERGVLPDIVVVMGMAVADYLMGDVLEQDVRVGLEPDRLDPACGLRRVSHGL